MLESTKFLSGVRTAGLAVPMLVIVTALSSCARDPLAPDCSLPDCSIPFPGAGDISGTCQDPPGSPPLGAVGAEYFYDMSDPSVLNGGTGVYTDFTALTDLPPGLSLDPDTGELTGIPEGPGNSAYPLTVEVTDALTGSTYTIECAEIEIRERLTSNAIRTEDLHCIPHTASKEDMVALLGGGDETEITCSALNPGDLPCPLGDGNGRPPPGISFNESSCTHSGDITGNRRGTWVWMVEIEQSGFKTRVPFCASRDVDAYHDISVVANAVPESDLKPGLLEYDPSGPVAFGNGSYIWTILDPTCVNDPNACNGYGFKFDVTCSPFDPPFALNASGFAEGIEHGLDAAGPTPIERFSTQPFVASFEMSYCTQSNGVVCDTESASFDDDAQTQYHFDVVGFPVINNP